MNVELVTLVMIENNNDEVLIQKRKLKYPGLSFPGGHVEKGEAILDCAIREVREETGLNVSNLQLCGIVHWSHNSTDERYICFMYKTSNYQGILIENNREGDNYWIEKSVMFEIPKEHFSTPIYALSPLLHKTGQFSEVFIKWDETSNEYNVQYK
jgi:8-oxo-dGTP diphosphatase